MKLENVFQYIKLKRIVSLPTWQAEFQGQVRYNEATDRLALAGPASWADITTETDLSAQTHVLADITDVTATATEVNYTDGVTSAIQTQLNAKAPTASPTFTGTVVLPNDQTLTTPTIASFTNATHNHLNASGGGQLSNYATFGPFVLNDVPGTANTDMSAQFMDTGTTVVQSTGQIYMPLNGEIVGIYATTDANRTAGTARFVPTVNGTAQTFDGGATCVLDGTNTRRHSIHVATGDGEDFASGDRVGIQCQTSGWTPTTANAVAWIVVRLDF